MIANEDPKLPLDPTLWFSLEQTSIVWREEGEHDDAYHHKHPKRSVSSQNECIELVRHDLRGFGDTRHTRCPRFEWCYPTSHWRRSCLDIANKRCHVYDPTVSSRIHTCSCPRWTRDPCEDATSEGRAHTQTLIVRSPLALTMYFSSKSTTLTAARWPTRTRRMVMSIGEFICQTAMDRSFEQVTIMPLSKRKWSTASQWCKRVFISSPVFTFQTRTVESDEPVTITVSSYCKHRTLPLCPVNTFVHSKVFRSQILMVLSRRPLMIFSSSYCKQ